MATTSETATVEVLTAEVRVLQVGSRQVTMSVYRQLDRVDPDEIEPFGRVRDGSDDPAWVYVVGRHVDTGALARSWRERHPTGSGCNVSDLVSVGLACARVGGILVVDGVSTPVWWVDSEAERCGATSDGETHPGDRWSAVCAGWHWRSAAARVEAERRVREMRRALADEAVGARDWARLPLIVLAGLR
jgi:hypothetical protein